MGMRWGVRKNGEDGTNEWVTNAMQCNVRTKYTKAHPKAHSIWPGWLPSERGWRRRAERALAGLRLLNPSYRSQNASLLLDLMVEQGWMGRALAMAE